MAIKKSELYSSLWKSCDELRGGMDASQYKDYILTMLFVKYVSDKAKKDDDSLIYVPNGGSFDDMIEVKGDKEIGDKMNKIIAKLAEENELKGVIDVADFNDSDKLGKGKDMIDKLTNLISIFQDEKMDFSKNKAAGDDILGDAYEYLMRNFATESGKSKGQFYTPAEVSRVLAKVIGIGETTKQAITVYDPTCGSGSLLIKAADEAKSNVTIYGQEMDNATAALAKMNMIMHSKETAEIWQDNTLSAPYFKNENNQELLKTFDFIVANPPFSTKAWSNGINPENDMYERFKGFGIPPAKNGDFAFLLHINKSLKSFGKAAVILPHGVLFRGNAEAIIRENIIKKGIIKGIIGLPANLFYGTGIPACIIVLDKENAETRKGIFMVDASKGFVKDGNKNRLREQDIHKIVEVFTRQIEIPKFSRMVTTKEIAEDNEYNLNIPRYIDLSEPEDIQDISSHLLGGIPNTDIDSLKVYWDVYSKLKDDLFSNSERDGYSFLNVNQVEIKETIFNHEQFITHQETIVNVFNKWTQTNESILKNLTSENKPKEIIQAISEDILKKFSEVALIDKYDVYQTLLTYWNETMQDDIYVIVDENWTAGNEVEWIYTEKKKLKGFEGKLIPQSLIIKRYFENEQFEIDVLEAKKDAIVQKQQEVIEEHGVEEGLLIEVINDSKITKKSLTKRIKEIKQIPEFEDEMAILKLYENLLVQETELKKQIKEGNEKLGEALIQKYSELTIDEIKQIIIYDKWFTSIKNGIDILTDTISQQLANRIIELAKRYEEPIPEIENDVEKFTAKVDEHLRRMGFVW
ncbi:type I restriction-modification system subunit M [Gottfriedia acidiceleris]|uniref:site-specific DNA-methyltransferase (adenine-specific) n=1 Tax=Gottfriedia acidiceleris TaxID=371036 RepID=A0ABY4JFP6_9BACI|nr:type I restriction-modification system subunit M [Gottfriedia acidiceleris]UPM52446.1 type I restriction-modification system subunit M [Gottfriedia acidiceleris]